MTDRARITPYFNRPVRPAAGMLEQLAADMATAQDRLCLASGWFTDTDVADALLASPARQKVLILNGADLKRGSRSAFTRVLRHFEARDDERAKIAEAMILATGETPDYEAPWLPRLIPRNADDDDIIMELGTADWEEGVMHHKFVLVDDRILWTGSYNYTRQARTNYENVLRIEDRELCLRYWREVGDLFEEQFVFTSIAGVNEAAARGAGLLRYYWVQNEAGPNVARCAHCDRLFPSDGYEGKGVPVCQECEKQLGVTW